MENLPIRPNSRRFGVRLALAKSSLAIAIAVGFSSGQSARAEWETWVERPAQTGDDFAQALRRVKPCLKPGSAEERDAINLFLSHNHEKVDSQGRFLLVEPKLWVTESFVRSIAECSPGGAEATVPKPEIVEHPTESADHAEHAKGESEAPVRELKIMGVLDGAKVDAVGTGGEHVNLTSKPRYGFAVEATQEHADWIFGAAFKWETAEFDEIPGSELTEQNKTESEGEIKIGRAWGEAVELSLGVGAGQVDRVVLPDDESIITSLDWMPKASFEAELKLYHCRWMSAALALGGTLWFPASAGRSIGTGEEAVLTLQHELNPHLGLELAPHAAYQRHETSDDSHSVFEYGFVVGVVGRY